MKKLLLSLAVLCLATLSAKAQNDAGEFDVKIRAGLAFSNLTNDNDGTWRTGLAIGLDFEYGLLDNLGLSAGVLYSQQGEKAKGFAATLNLDYIDVPILANFYVTPWLCLKAGLQPGFMVKQRFKFPYYGDYNPGDDFDIKKNAVDLSIPVGLSFHFYNFMIDARYNWGVTAVYPEQEVTLIIPQSGKQTYYQPKSRNSVFWLTVGYRFSFQ